MHKIFIAGAGPAGLTAALYAARAGVAPLVLERAGGQLAEAPHVENYPAILRATGAELLAAMRGQAAGNGAEFIRGTAKQLVRIDGGWRVELTRGTPIEARAVVAATGASRRRLGVDGEKEFLGAGVSYCAVCDGAFFKNLDVAVIGGGDSAVEDALYLSALCKTVYIVHRRETFRASAARLDRARAAANIEFRVGYTVERIAGDGTVKNIVLRRAGAAAPGTLTLDVSAVFVAVGTVPDTAWLDGAVPLDSSGYAAVGEDCKAADGLWVAGDLRRKPVRQIVTACSDGAVAGKAAADFE